MIRTYEETDFESVNSLLQVCGLPSAQAAELVGVAFVAEEEDRIIGFVWALIGESTKAFIDHFCVHPDFRGKDATGRSQIAVELMICMLSKLALMDKKVVCGQLQANDVGRSLERIYNALGMKFTEPHVFAYGNPKEILNNLNRLKYGIESTN